MVWESIIITYAQQRLIFFMMSSPLSYSQLLMVFHFSLLYGCSSQIYALYILMTFLHWVFWFVLVYGLLLIRSQAWLMMVSWVVVLWGRCVLWIDLEYVRMCVGVLSLRLVVVSMSVQMILISLSAVVVYTYAPLPYRRWPWSSTVPAPLSKLFSVLNFTSLLSNLISYSLLSSLTSPLPSQVQA